ncbi:MAG: carotenoid cleavage dioxygenase [Monoraphidium minutum]|nr:MAG: carotenoid cleavage dioxygenase [Monoraphidium minutum]
MAPSKSSSWSIASLPQDLGRFAWKQIYYLLSRPNKAYGDVFLEGNFAPVADELFDQELELLEGSIPQELDGAFLRVGPNPALAPVGGYHWFDGDGMVHACRIKGGRATYCNRWVDTARLRQERDAGYAHCLKLGDYVGLSGLALLMLNKARHRLGLVDASQGLGTANTAMVAHAGRLMALNEGDMPYALKLACDGLLETVGRVSLGKAWAGRSFTAHPKLDPETGKLYFFRYTFDAPPYATAGVLGAGGEVEAEMALDLPRPVMMHDMAISRSYMIFMDHPLVFDGERMVKGALPFKFAPEHGSRIGLLRKDARDAAGMTWFKLPAFMVFHVANAWEEDDGKVKLFVCYHDSISLDLDTRTTATGGIPKGEQPRLAVVTLDPASGAADLRVLSEAVGDFPTIDPRRAGLKTRYAYLASMVTKNRAVKWEGASKLDLTAAGLDTGVDACVGRIRLPPGHHNGETVFVPRHDDPAQCASDDDGFLITFVHDEAAGSSYLGIWDAATMDDAPLAKLALPRRVPYGFHALWAGAPALKASLARAAAA